MINHVRWLMFRDKVVNGFRKLDAAIKRIRDPWTYQCPNCRRKIKSYRPKQVLKLVLNCPKCSYQFLIGGELLTPYAINPRIILNDAMLCQHGCHNAAPFGFVVMAGCPRHD